MSSLTRDQIIAAVYTAVDVTNKELPPEKPLKQELSAKLMGPDAALDSLALITFILAVEKKIEEMYGLRLALTEEQDEQTASDALATIETLVVYIEQMVKKVVA